MWFCEFERKYRDGDGMAKTGGIYEFGYWTDVLAVRPGFKFPDAPVTKTGQNYRTIPKHGTLRNSDVSRSEQYISS